MARQDRSIVPDACASRCAEPNPEPELLHLPIAVLFVVHAAHLDDPKPFAERRLCCSSADSARIDSTLADEMRRAHAPGATLVVTERGRVVYERALGVRSVETREPITARSLVRIGSVTKTVTALTAVVLATRGALDLDAPIARYARDLPAPFRRLTMRQLLSHTAGMVNEGAGTGSHDADALRRRVLGWNASERLGPANDIYSYSSPGYWLAGYVLSAVTGMDYASTVRSTLLAPLGMPTATYDPLVAFTYSVALDHRASGDSAIVLRPFPDDASTWPSGSLFASAQELARLATAIADSGRVEGRRALDPAVIRTLTSRQVRAPGPDGATCGHALGLSYCDDRGTTVFSHYGFRTGAGAVLTVVPARGAAIVILANGPGAIMHRTEQAVLDILLGAQDTTARGGAPAMLRALPAALAGSFVAGADTLTLFARGDSAFYRYRSTTPQPIRAYADSSVNVLDADGNVEQTFRLVRGRSGEPYLHDGLNAFRRAPRSRPSAGPPTSPRR
jgi:CubicO group peptidase (beta-lactamase class C family)